MKTRKGSMYEAASRKEERECYMEVAEVGIWNERCREEVVFEVR